MEISEQETETGRPLQLRQWNCPRLRLSRSKLRENKFDIRPLLMTVYGEGVVRIDYIVVTRIPHIEVL